MVCSCADSLKTKKDIDNAVMFATSVAREIDSVRAKRQRFHEDPMLHAMTSRAARGFLQTLEESSRVDPHFRKFPPAAQQLQQLTTVLLESGAEERKARYKSDSCAYKSLAASQALLTLLRREYALAETLLAVTTALSSASTQATLNTSLKMSDAAMASLTSLCDQMRASSGAEHLAAGPSSAAAAPQRGGQSSGGRARDGDGDE